MIHPRKRRQQGSPEPQARPWPASGPSSVSGGGVLAAACARACVPLRFAVIVTCASVTDPVWEGGCLLEGELWVHRAYSGTLVLGGSRLTPFLGTRLCFGVSSEIQAVSFSGTHTRDMRTPPPPALCSASRQFYIVSSY